MITTRGEELAAKLRKEYDEDKRLYTHSSYCIVKNSTVEEIIAALESKSSTKDESLEALEAAVEAQIEIGEKLFEHNPYAVGSLEAYRYVLKLIADAKEQGEPKETRVE